MPPQEYWHCTARCVCVCFGSDGDILVTECNPAHYTHVTYCIGIYGGEARQVIGIALQRAISTQLTNNTKMRKGVGSTRDNNVDLCSSLPLDERLLSAA